MKCHYEVLEVETFAPIDEVKRAYKKLALKYHPDRNFGKEDWASDMFKEVSSAYAVLNDPHEKQWYDDHRDMILRGGKPGGQSGGDDEEDDYIINLWPYFSPSCHSADIDGDAGFYATYAVLFEKLSEQEASAQSASAAQKGAAAGAASRASSSWPFFGRADSSSADVLRFYNYWSEFSSKLSFSWEDKFDTTEAPNRNVRRSVRVAL
jgi:DnaJ homolog subfamily A member 5